MSFFLKSHLEPQIVCIQKILQPHSDKASIYTFFTIFKRKKFCHLERIYLEKNKKENYTYVMSYLEPDIVF